MRSLEQLMALRAKHKKNFDVVNAQILEMGGEAIPIQLTPIEAIEEAMAGKVASFNELLNVLWERDIAGQIAMRCHDRRANLRNCIYYAIRCGKLYATSDTIKTMRLWLR